MIGKIRFFAPISLAAQLTCNDAGVEKSTPSVAPVLSKLTVAVTGPPYSPFAPTRELSRRVTVTKSLSCVPSRSNAVNSALVNSMIGGWSSLRMVAVCVSFGPKVTGNAALGGSDNCKTTVSSSSSIRSATVTSVTNLIPVSPPAQVSVWGKKLKSSPELAVPPATLITAAAGGKPVFSTAIWWVRLLELTSFPPSR